jgi:hypothetical protein
MMIGQNFLLKFQNKQNKKRFFGFSSLPLVFLFLTSCARYGEDVVLERPQLPFSPKVETKRTFEGVSLLGLTPDPLIPQWKIKLLIKLKSLKIPNTNLFLILVTKKDRFQNLIEALFY